MYVPEVFASAEAEVADSVHRWPFAALVTAGTGLQGSHVPLVLVGDRLVGHLARGNPQVDALDGEVLAIFLGPHAYVSAEWYEEPARQVPTWNYVAVHAHGVARQLPDPHLALAPLLARFEPRGPMAEDTDREAFVDRLARGIVGFEITVTRWDAKAKLSQNKSLGERKRVMAALSAGDDPAKAVAAEMARRGLG